MRQVQGIILIMEIWHRKTVRAYIFDPDKKAFLLAKSSLPPFGYHLPGGGINRKEKPEDATRRELREELNILPENIIHVSYMRSRKTRVMWIPHAEDIFLVIVKGVQIKLSWELSEAKWVTTEKLRNKGNQDIIDKALEIIY